MLNEFILNVEKRRQQKITQIVREGVYDQPDLTADMKRKFANGDRPDDSAVWSVLREVSERSHMGIEDVKGA